MNRNLLFTVESGITALLGATGCTSKSTTQKSVKTQQEIKLGGSSRTHTATKIVADADLAQNQNVKLTFVLKGQSGDGIAGVSRKLSVSRR